MKRAIDTSEIGDAVKALLMDVNYRLSPDVANAITSAEKAEQSPLGKKVLGTLTENLRVADAEQIPICQDTGMAVIFLDIGQDVELMGEFLDDAVNRGVRAAYTEGYLRKSVVSDPIERKNSGDNTPAIIHTRIVKGNEVTITAAPKGFGSENMSRVFMLKPAQGIEGVKEAVLETVKAAGPNACPPFVVGVGIGGDFEESALMAKRALTREIGSKSDVQWAADLEKELFDSINSLGIGPAGLGGSVTALAVHIITYPTHIAGLPVAVNMCCHVDRHGKVTL